MKHFTQILAGVCALALFALSLPAQESFNTTNIVAFGVAITGSPTNNVGTNGLPLDVGGCINVANYASVDIVFAGYNASANASKITATIAASDSSAPVVINGTQTTLETTPSFTITAASPAAAGPWYWRTNVPVGSARWLGITSLTNNTSSASITNFSVQVAKKILPTSLSGGNW
ncbi:MAG: hypothetical protein KGL39_53850 [Patescibacteria group bacterium]|nr:hypothetical protein [Patescibacteria group bacterium]